MESDINTEDDTSGLRQRQVLQRSISSSEDFLCGCCFDLMVQPTTLTCGHSFCRLCIADWYLTSKKTECPQCRSPWTGNPQVNITLRNLLHKMHSDSLTEREGEILTEEAKAKIAKFDKTMSDDNEAGSRQATGQGFFGGICFAMGIVVVIYLSWYWRSSDQDLLVHKPLTKWTAEDVELWLTDMGAWTLPYAQVVKDKNIGGHLVLGMDEETLVSTFNITDPLHRKALLNSIYIVQTKGVKAPSNLWEFKALYPGWALFLLYGLKDYPRTCLLYLYFFEYETMFLPFVHVICPVSASAPRYDFTYPPHDLTPLQWAEFLPKYLFLPYYLIGEFTWDWLDIHWWTARFILVNCFVMTVLEANYVVKYVIRQEELGTVTAEIKKMFKSYLSIGVFFLIWPIIPSFVCDCFFYVAMYFSPYQGSEQLLRLWRR